MATSLDETPLEGESVEAVAGESPGSSSASASPSLSRHALRPESTESAPVSLREQFWNLPNTITVGRAIVVPVLLLLPFFPGEGGSTIMAWVFIAAAVSDIVDGWLARRGQLVTHIGKLLDPLADKLLVSTALIALLAIGRIPPWAVWMVAVIIGRELAVTGLRGIASAGGQIVAASPLGKIKTVTQNIAVGALLFHFETLGLDAHAVGLFFLTIATGLTIASGYSYFASYFRGLDEGSADGGNGT